MTVLYQKAVRISLLITIFIVIKITSYGQQKNTITLQSIIDSVQKHLPVLLEKQSLINSANAGITDARHSRLPVLRAMDEISASSSNNLAGVYFPMSTIPSVSGSIRSTSNFQPEFGNIGMLYSEYDIYDFGLQKARINSAKAFAGLAEADFQRELYLLKWQAGKAYFDLLQNEYQLGIDGQNIHRYEDIYKVIQALTISGLRAGADSSQIIAELSRTRFNYNLTAGKINQLEQQLTYYTGIANFKLVIDTGFQASNTQLLPDLNSTIDTAGNPFINYYTAQTNYYKVNQQLINKSFQPRVVLLGGLWGRGSSIQYNDQYKSAIYGVGYQRFNYAFAISFVYNLFDVVHRRDKLAINQYRTEASNYELQDEQQSLINELQKATAAINTTKQNLMEVPVQMAAAKDGYAQKLAQYNAGTINLIDLTNASFILYRAQTDYLQILNDWYSSNLNKAAITGNLDQFIKSIKK